MYNKRCIGSGHFFIYSLFNFFENAILFINFLKIFFSIFLIIYSLLNFCEKANTFCKIYYMKVP